MDRISTSLQEQITAAGPDSSRRLALIITLESAVEQEEGVRRLAEAGLEVTGGEEGMGVVYGKAAIRDIPRLAETSVVQLVEPEGEVRALD